MEQGTTGESTSKRYRGPGRNPRLRAEAGQRFGQGVVIDPAVRVTARNLRGARLTCDCGREYMATLQRLLSGRSKSCGCRRPGFVDLTGRRYGKLLVIQFAGMKPSKDARWLCKCDCGNEMTVDTRELNRGNTASCGCSRRKPRDPDIPQRAARNRVLRSYKGTCARSRGHCWELADEDFDRLMSQDCYYCGQPPSLVTRSQGRYEGGEFVHGSLDRVDNNLGYTLENTVACCVICNHAKKDMSVDEFMAWIARLTERLWFHPELLDSHLLKSVI